MFSALSFICKSQYYFKDCTEEEKKKIVLWKAAFSCNKHHLNHSVKCMVTLNKCVNHFFSKKTGILWTVLKILIIKQLAIMLKTEFYLKCWWKKKKTQIPVDDVEKIHLSSFKRMMISQYGVSYRKLFSFLSFALDKSIYN